MTHSVAFAVLLLAFGARHAACGMGGGSGVHLAADCFPNAMTGYATVKLPLLVGIGAGLSYLWLAANALLALALAAVLLRRLHHPHLSAAVAIGAVAFAVAYLWRTDGGWPVLAVIAGAGWAAWRRRRTRAG